MLRPAYPHWQSKAMFYKVRLLAGERNQLGIPCITLPPNPSSQDRTAAYDFVTQLAAHKRTGLVIPNGATFKIHGTEGVLFDTMPDIEHHNQQISYVALDFFSNLGRGTSSGGTGGSRALGQSQGKFFNLALQNVAAYIAQRFTQIDLRYWTIFNYGLDAPRPLLRVSNVQARSFEEVMEILTNGAQAGLVRSDKGIRAEVRNETGMPVETVDDVITARGVTDSVGPETGTVGAGTEQPENGQKGKGQEGDANSEALSETVMARQPAQPLVAPRAHPSPFFKEGDPEHLRHVYPNEAHVDFPAHWRALRGAEARIASVLRSQRGRAIRALANQMAKALIAGERPGDVRFERPDDLNAKLAAILDPLYAIGQSEVRAEHERLRKEQADRQLGRLADRQMGSGQVGNLSAELPISLSAQPPKQGGLFAQIAAQFFDEALENDATNAGISMLKKYGDSITDRNAGELADELFGAIDDNADGFIDTIADQSARGSFRKGRGDEFDQVADELERQGYKLQMIRVCAMEKESCDSCREANGQPLDPGEDITAIHEGPPDTCECEAMESI
jgi:hypothetical protein